MKGFKITIKMASGRRESAFTGYMKTKEDAEKYAEWVGSEAQIREVDRPKIATYAVFNSNSLCGLKYV